MTRPSKLPHPHRPHPAVDWAIGLLLGLSLAAMAIDEGRRSAARPASPLPASAAIPPPLQP